MCGIAGIYDIHHDISNQSPIFYEMQKILKINDSGEKAIYSSEHVALIHTSDGQLSVYEESQQKLILIYNGAIYNYIEVRNDLEKLGYQFNSSCESEVILKSYIAWKEEALQHLNGVFAFAIYDKQKENLFLARDPIGVKSLFYTKINETFLFASEIKALFAHPLVEAQIDVSGIAELMLIGPGKTPGSAVFKNIQELKAGEYAYIHSDQIEIVPYYHLKDQLHLDDLDLTIEKVHDLVKNAIISQLDIDKEIGTFLSGGLDSSIVSAIAANELKKKGKRLKTFSLDYVDNDKFFKPSNFQPSSDNESIKIMTQFLDSEHTTYQIHSHELMQSLNDAVDARDLPGMADIDSSLLLFAKEAKKTIDIAFSGECADEIFGGYPWYRDELIRNQAGFPWANNINYRMHFLKDEWQQKIDAEDFVNSRYVATINQTDKQDNILPVESRMKEMMQLNLNWFMQTLLKRNECMSNAANLEIRVPFCDIKILEYLYTVPWIMKEYGDREKGLLRIAMQEYLPKEILWRKKSPFPKTHNPQYLQLVRNQLQILLNQKEEPVWQLLKKSEVEKLLTSENNLPWYGQLMTTPQTIAYFLQINYWLKKYKVKIIK